MTIVIITTILKSDQKVRKMWYFCVVWLRFRDRIPVSLLTKMSVVSNSHKFMKNWKRHFLQKIIGFTVGIVVTGRGVEILCFFISKFQYAVFHSMRSISLMPWVKYQLFESNPTHNEWNTTYVNTQARIANLFSSHFSSRTYKVSLERYLEFWYHQRRLQESFSKLYLFWYHELRLDKYDSHALLSYVQTCLNQ